MKLLSVVAKPHNKSSTSSLDHSLIIVVMFSSRLARLTGRRWMIGGGGSNAMTDFAFTSSKPINTVRSLATEKKQTMEKEQTDEQRTPLPTSIRRAPVEAPIFPLSVTIQSSVKKEVTGTQLV
jgi:hypothetical protein